MVITIGCPEPLHSRARERSCVSGLGVSVTSDMALSLLPTTAELATLTTLDAIRSLTGLDADVWHATSAAMGGVPAARVLALTPPDVIKRMLASLRIVLTDGSAIAGRSRLRADSSGNNPCGVG